MIEYPARGVHRLLKWAANKFLVLSLVRNDTIKMVNILFKNCNFAPILWSSDS